MHAVAYSGNIVGFEFRQIFAFFCHQFPANPNFMDMELFQIIQQHNVRTVAGSDGASVIESKAFCRIQCCHTDGCHGVNAFFYAHTQVVVQVTFLQDGFRLSIVGAQQASAAVFRCHAFEQSAQVMAGRAFTQQDIHTQTQTFFHIFHSSAFMVALDSGTGISGQVFACQTGRMTVDEFSCVFRNHQFI